MKTVQELIEEWKEIQSKFEFSSIQCAVCRELLYYGNYLTITKKKVLVKTCYCVDAIIFNEKCTTCHAPAQWITQNEDAVRFRCTCGHTATIPSRKIAETFKA